MFDVSSAIIQIQQYLIGAINKNTSFFVAYAPYLSAIFSLVIGASLSPVFNWIKYKVTVSKVVIDELKDEQSSLKEEVLRYLNLVEKLHSAYSFKISPSDLEIRGTISRYFMFSKSYREMFYERSDSENKKSFKKIIKCYDRFSEIHNDIDKTLKRLREKRNIMINKIKFFEQKFIEEYKNCKECKEYDDVMKELVLNINSHVKLALNVIKHVDNILESKKSSSDLTSDIVVENEKMFKKYFNKEYDDWHMTYSFLLEELSF